MVLSDWEIVFLIAKGEIVITPLVDAAAQVGASSIDLRLGTEFRVIKRLLKSHFDLQVAKEKVKQEVREYTEVVHLQVDSPFVLHPGEFALATTLEYLRIPDYLAARIEGRSTWGRVGLQIHSTAGFVDPGFEGTLTFELHNMGKLPLPLYPGVRISQLSFHRCSPAVTPYSKKAGAKYARSTGVKDTMFYEDYEYELIRSRNHEPAPTVVGSEANSE
jgi:dCTP deaminase